VQFAPSTTWLSGSPQEVQEAGSAFTQWQGPWQGCQVEGTCMFVWAGFTYVPLPHLTRMLLTTFTL